MFRIIERLNRKTGSPALDAQQSQAAPVIPARPLPRQEILTAFKGGGITFFGRFFEYMIRFAFGIIITRFLGAAAFGLYTMTLLTVDLCATFAGLSLSEASVRFVPIFRRDQDEKGLRGAIQVNLALPTTIALFLGVLLFANADWVAQRIFHKPELGIALRLASAIVPISTLFNGVDGVMRGFNRLDYSVYAGVIGLEVPKLIITTVFLLLGMQLFGALSGVTIARLLAVAFALYMVNRLFPLKRSLVVARWEAGKLLRFSLPLYLGQIISSFQGSLESLILSIIGTTISVGVFSVALRIAEISMMFYIALAMATMPIVSDLHHRGDLAELGRFYQTTTKWSFASNLPVFLTTSLFAKPLLLVFGQDFVTGAVPLIIVVLGVLVNAGTGINLIIVSMTGHTRISFANSVIRVGSALILDLLLIPRWNIVGAAVAVAASSMVLNIVGVLEVYRLFRMWPYNSSFLKPVLAGSIAAVVGYMTSRWLFTDSGPIAVLLSMTSLWLAYAGLLWVLKPSQDDQLILDALKNRLGSILNLR